MKKFILGTKIGMSQYYDNTGKIVPVSLINITPNSVVNVKKEDKEGYNAIQIACEEGGKASNSRRGQFKQVGKVFRFLKEFRDAEGDFKTGDELTAKIFEVGDKVRVYGISKGKGFAGVVKRHGFHGHNATHGTAHCLRRSGSLASKRVGKVAKGKKMGGRMGGERVVTFGLTVSFIDSDKNVLGIMGSVPGRKGTLLEIVSEKA